MQKSYVQKIAQAGLLVALEVVLTRFLSFNTFSLRIGFGFVPVVMAGILLGPVWAGGVAAVADFLGASLFLTTGVYFPGFTLTAALVGITYGALLHKNISFKRILLAVAIVRIPLSLGLNTLWISLLYGKAFFVLLPARIVQEAVMCVVQVAVILLITSKFTKMLKRSA